MTTLGTDDHHRLATPATHEHGWLVESSHAVSTGRILYVRCAECGVRRVDHQDHRRRPPEPLSRELPGRPARTRG
ncbi:hypothetical protein [Isoptericola croceus]|uniref:hypothetical protein n=1 Tax=Isoptericola croceus TaxID=3031406 RepID=UPI0023F7EA66|nr:hypothetical protein [Isoptericola croceus]